jgi:hypothetical protein
MAASITYTVQLDSKTQPGMFPQWDGTLGPLNEVDFSATGQAGTELAVNSTDPLSGTYRDDLAFALIDPKLNVYPLADFRTTGSFSAPNASYVDIGQTFNVSSVIPASSQFLGTGMFNLQVGYSAAITSPSVFASSRSSFAVGSATVTYVYGLTQAVPEPPSAVLAVTAAVVGLGCWLFRRRRLSGRARLRPSPQ